MDLVTEDNNDCGHIGDEDTDAADDEALLTADSANELQGSDEGRDDDQDVNDEGQETRLVVDLVRNRTNANGQVDTVSHQNGVVAQSNDDKGEGDRSSGHIDAAVGVPKSRSVGISDDELNIAAEDSNDDANNCFDTNNDGSDDGELGVSDSLDGEISVVVKGVDSPRFGKETTESDGKANAQQERS